MSQHGYELDDWRQATQEAIENYLRQPCMANAQKMLDITKFWPSGEMQNECGTLLAIVEECKRAGIIHARLTYLMYQVFFQIARLLTRRERTWNDYWGLRWMFTQDRACAEALHDRLHVRHQQASLNTEMCIRSMLADDAFAAAFGIYALDVKHCRFCFRTFFNDDDQTDRILARIQA
jgi:hypothetical protein